MYLDGEGVVCRRTEPRDLSQKWIESVTWKGDGHEAESTQRSPTQREGGGSRPTQVCRGTEEGMTWGSEIGRTYNRRTDINQRFRGQQQGALSLQPTIR